ncbi:MAG: MiaB/RimO family radical SAM methylthiotransferase, partial [Alphaproteobacteria bacterium]|nr:MiaB/RimO family radical SAM methylthiotransferase [Alphaproteobacteria bacterium]
EYSRSLQSIVDEVKVLVEGGAREITLLGQNVNAYRDEASGAGLVEVIHKIALINGLLRIRYTTSHPLDMEDGLIEAHRDVEKLMPFLHLPVQSGSDKILDAMNRKHKAKDYLQVIDRLRKAQPALALSSDFIVGFPSESDADFEATMALVREVGYAQAFSFKYSRRAGTPAASMDQQVAEEVKEERLSRLQALLRQQQTDFNLACLGKKMSVLIENTSRMNGMMFGKTVYLQTARIKGEASMIGTEQWLDVQEARPNSLAGEKAIG